MTTSRLMQGVADSTAQRDRDALDLSIARMLTQFLQAHSVSLFHLLEDAGTRRVQRRVTVRDSERELGIESAEVLAKLRSLADGPVSWRDCVANDRVIEGLSPDQHLMTVFPLHAQREVMGLLVIESAASLPVPHIDLIHAILRIVENHLALLDYGERDTLTGLLNRKTFESHFEKVRHRHGVMDAAAHSGNSGPVAGSNGSSGSTSTTGNTAITGNLSVAGSSSATGVNAHEPSWLALVDIDKFKTINDSHGHLFGDEVLLLVSQLMKRNFRGADQLFRFGGEEFLIVLDSATEAGARIAIERLRASIEAHAFPQIGRVTISVGYTQITPQDVSTTCVERADDALYYAKGHGRNNVRYYEELVASGELIAKTDSTDVELF